MGNIRAPQKAALFAGIITVSEQLAAEALKEAEAVFGEAEFKSPLVKFNFTDYYNTEMGEELLRQWIGFKSLIDPGKLGELKITSNALEEKYATGGKRRINIDPGYMTPAKIVLASSKDFSHRIYIGNGIYAEVTLIYRHKAFRPLAWTYPDYQSPPSLEFFEKLRKCFGAKLKENS